MALLDEIKPILRVSGTDFDLEITGLIEACKLDLALSGVGKVAETDALTKMAITLYCKANFGWDNQEFERLQKSYDLLKIHLSLSADYQVTP
jgi:hypothetical protein